MTDRSSQSQFRYFFVRGYMRSGTNWLERILNLHPDINCNGEFNFQTVQKAVQRFTTYSWHVASRDPAKTVAISAFQDFVRKVMSSQAANKPGATLLGDRSPQLLAELLPDSHYIWIHRDARDVLVSWTFHKLNTGISDDFDADFAQDLAAYKTNPNHFADNPDRLLASERWVRHIAGDWAARARSDLANWQAARAGNFGTSRVHRIAYEDLLTDTETHRREIYTVLNLNPDLAAPLDTTPNTTPGLKTETPTAFNRRATAGDWKRYFTDQVNNWFNEAAANELKALGYEPATEMSLVDAGTQTGVHA